MRAWQTYGYGDMRLEDVPDPQVRPGWVKVRVRVVQPSITETLLFQGRRTYGHALIEKALAQAPARLFGHEFSAEVIEVGDGVTSLRPGDRVAARGSHPDGIVGFDYPGAFAELGVFPEGLLAVLPAHVSDREGAAIQPLTDAVAAVHAAGIRLGDVVVIVGQGSMGLSCMQVARVAGAGLVVAIARRDAVLEMSRALGADIVLNATRQDVVAAVRELTAGRGADVVFETAGGPVEQGLAGNATLLEAAAMLCDHGRVVGVAFTGDAAVLPYAAFRSRSLRFLFPSILDRPMFEATIRLVASGRVRLAPMITCGLEGLEQVPRAFEMTANKAAHGLINPAQVVVSN